MSLTVHLFGSQDFTIFGGSLSSAHAKKICKVGVSRVGSIYLDYKHSEVTMSLMSIVQKEFSQSVFNFLRSGHAF